MQLVVDQSQFFLLLVAVQPELFPDGGVSDGDRDGAYEVVGAFLHDAYPPHGEAFQGGAQYARRVGKTALVVAFGRHVRRSIEQVLSRYSVVVE